MSDIKKFWMVLCDGSTYIYHRHTSYSDAVQEAKRLTQDPDNAHDFFVLECIGVMTPKPIVPVKREIEWISLK